jgi:16S rRNA (uracil1498-N3)-methyltransferase
MIRVLVHPGHWPRGSRGGLLDGEGHHLRVRRAREGDPVQLLDGAGLVGSGRLVLRGREWEVEVEEAERRLRPVELTLAVGAGDRERFAWLVEKAAELGVTRVVPLETARTAGVASRLRDQHLDRLRRTALEALKQCGSAWATEVTEPMSVGGFRELASSGAGWLADATGAPPPALLDLTPLTVVVGPEGGFTEEETGELRAAGYRPTSLATHTLRFETAAVSAASAAIAARLRRSHG